MNKHIVVGLSGGVDSAVTAWLLKDKGFKVTGLFMKNWEDDDDDEFCTSKQDLIDAVSVSEKIGIDIEVVNFAKGIQRKSVFFVYLRPRKRDNAKSRYIMQFRN
jgi:tRNA-specific 2-thiouridylase